MTVAAPPPSHHIVIQTPPPAVPETMSVSAIHFLPSQGMCSSSLRVQLPSADHPLPPRRFMTVQNARKSSPSTARCHANPRRDPVRYRSSPSSSLSREDSRRRSCSPRASTASPCASHFISFTAPRLYNVEHP